ncbi:MAG: laminin G domain-containing protein, partial [Planctomycetes bacterium]|nr:laminin G domain-containing protein [Planctomycetota bacterium]
MCKKLLCLLTLVFVIGGVAVAGTAEPNLVAWYRFDDGSGTTASDLSGNDYDATVSSSGNWSSDDYGYCLANCSTYGNLYVDVPDDVFSTVNKQVTVSMWIWNPDADYSMGGLIKADAPSQSKDKILSMSIYDNGSNPASYYFVSTAGEDSSGSSDVQWWWGYNNYYSSDLEEWHHVAMVKDCDADVEKLYYDGEEVANYDCDTDKIMADIENCRIFTSRASGTNNWWDSYHGKMADVKIFDRALSAREISEQAGNNLIAWWKFEETSGTIAHDSGACRYDGTLGNNNSWDGGVVFTGDNYGASKVGFTTADATDIFSTVDDQVTIAFWAKNDFDNCTGHSALFTGKNSASTILLRAELPASSDDLVFKAGSGESLYHWDINNSSEINYLPMEQWHHYALVKDADEGYMKIYINGYLVSQGTNKTASMAGIVNFELCGSSANWHQFAGTVRDFRIYDTALDVYEIDGIYRQYENEFNNVYYIDADNGNDNYAGTSPATAWESLNKFNSITFQPLDKILFKAGCVWSGNMNLHGSGRSGEPIVIDAYGDVSDEDDKPRINSGGSGTPLTIDEVENWEINNLQLTNLGQTAALWRRAVRIYADDCGKRNHIYLKDLYIHSVNGVLGFGSGGIVMGINESSETLSHYNDIVIEGCHFETVDDTAILGGAGMPAHLTGPNGTHIRIRNNYFEDIGSAAIVPIGSDGMIVEGNVVNGAMKRGPSCAIWPWAAENTIVQYNEVYNCDDRGDGEAYDCDYFCDGTIFQYNYSHDNPGGFMRICNGDPDIGDYNRNSIVRYNISVNDGGGDDALIELWKKLENCKVYNNILYIPSGRGAMNFVMSNMYGGGDGGTNYW